MYSAVSYTSPKERFTERQVSTHKNYKNKLKIIDSDTIDKKIKIEISYVKNNGIMIKNLFIDAKNLENIISQFKEKKFIIEDLSKIENTPTTLNYTVNHNSNNLLNNLNRIGFNNSFNQKYC